MAGPSVVEARTQGAYSAVTSAAATHIVLDIWGGHTAFAQESAGPWRSIGVSVVGPLSNAALSLAAVGVLRSTSGSDLVDLLLSATATSNLLVAVFNLLPGLPLDGGRVLEALVWRVSGDRLTGTVVAGWSGRLVAALTAGAAVLITLQGRGLSTAIWLALIAGLLWQGAGQSIALARWQRRAGQADAATLQVAAVAVPSTATLAGALLAAIDAGAHAIVVLDVYGRPASVVDEREAGAVPAARADQVAATDVAHPLTEGAILEAGLSGDELIRRLQARPAERYAVLDGDDQVVGVLDWQDVARFVAAS